MEKHKRKNRDEMEADREGEREKGADDGRRQP